MGLSSFFQKVGAKLYEKADDKEKLLSTLDTAKKVTAGSTALFTGLASGLGTFVATKSIGTAFKVGVATATGTGLLLASPKAVGFVKDKVIKTTTGEYGKQIGELIEAPKEEKQDKAKDLLLGAGTAGLIAGAGYLAYDWYQGRDEEKVIDNEEIINHLKIQCASARLFINKTLKH